TSGPLNPMSANVTTRGIQLSALMRRNTSDGDTAEAAAAGGSAKAAGWARHGRDKQTHVARNNSIASGRVDVRRDGARFMRRSHCSFTVAPARGPTHLSSCVSFGCGLFAALTLLLRHPNRGSTPQLCSCVSILRPI